MIAKNDAKKPMKRWIKMSIGLCSYASKTLNVLLHTKRQENDIIFYFFLCVMFKWSNIKWWKRLHV